jgi:hypothetical protein
LEGKFRIPCRIGVHLKIMLEMMFFSPPPKT